MNCLTSKDAFTPWSDLPLGLPSYTRISIDTRTLLPGDLFIALNGPNFQGSVFTQEALSKGACAVIQEYGGAETLQDPRIFRVEDSLALLYCLAQSRRKKIKGLCYAITGSAGKTTTKEGLAYVLRNFGMTHASTSSYNNHIGVPLSVANCPAEAQYAIFEVGTNHPGEIEPLVAHVQPHISMLTTLSEAHIENFRDIKAIAEEKFEIFRGEIGILPVDFPFVYLRDKKKIRWITYGLEKGDVHSKGPWGTPQTVLQVYTPKGKVAYCPSLWCPHWIEVNLGILAAFLATDIDLQEACDHLSSFLPLKGRGAFVYYDALDIGCIDESYNAAPVAMRSCIHAFALRQVPGRKILILGEMGELGHHGPRLHEELVPLVESVYASHIFLVGELFHDIAISLAQKGHEVYWALALSSVLDTLKSVLLPGDTVLVKGKNSAHMNEVLSMLERWNVSRRS